MIHPVKKKFTAWLAAAVMALISHGVLAEAEPVKVGVLKFGTVNWELKSMKHAEYDLRNGVDVEIVPYAGGDATRIALQGGEVDVIVADWLWVSRQRSDGQKLTFVPYSSSVGAIMVGADSGIDSLEGLKGCLLYTSPSPRDATLSRMPSSA